MAVQKGSPAPAFKLPCRPGEEVDVGACLGREKVVLLFFPLAFSPVCTEEMCHFRDHWGQWSSLDAKVFGISVDSPFVTEKFRAEMNIPFPILSDFNKEVAARYGALHEDLKGLKGVAKRAAFVIGPEGKVAYVWVSEDPRVQVPFAEVRSAVEGRR
ncbi:MAG: redoxin domain-containing protein [Planctomycetota bacterium]|jgi:peroxiredoxin